MLVRVVCYNFKVNCGQNVGNSWALHFCRLVCLVPTTQTLGNCIL